MKLFSLKFVCLFVCFLGEGRVLISCLDGHIHLEVCKYSVQGVWCLDTFILLVISRTLLLYIEEAFIRLFSILICLESMLPITHPRPLPRVRHCIEYLAFIRLSKLYPLPIIIKVISSDGMEFSASI